ncbi:hypothetical protein CKO22_17310 [Thiococcus pfennigii]|nr:hypothetical protein [Thiococcus pfennigii]
MAEATSLTRAEVTAFQERVAAFTGATYGVATVKVARSIDEREMSGDALLDFGDGTDSTSWLAVHRGGVPPLRSRSMLRVRRVWSVHPCRGRIPAVVMPPSA